ncbi:MAG: glycosyltransferase family 4 protein [SAR324 cluster bacterium]|nr:glycosyltransferase family 4 protein [SAR324 cluster bacterium]
MADGLFTIQIGGASFIISALLSLLLIRLAYRINFGRDELVGIQKNHTGNPSRMGGLAFLLTILFCGLLFSDIFILDDWLFYRLYILSVLPAFFGGLIEDITHKVGNLIRFNLTMLSAFLVYFTIGASIESFGISYIDNIFLQYKVIKILITTIAIAGIANGTNMLDGFNGILLSFAMLCFGAYGYLSWELGDFLLFNICIISLGAVAGVFIFNYPYGKIFAGDSGSYSIGFFLATLAVMLYARHPNQISPIAVGTVLSYPTFEVLFSIGRRRFSRLVKADGRHLHQLVFYFINQQKKDINCSNNNNNNNNKLVVLYLFLLYSLPIITSIIFYDNGFYSMIGFFVFMISYLTIYFSLSRRLAK